jgi:hypothetical protein
MPNARLAVSTRGTSCDAVKDDVKPDTDIVIDNEVVTDALKEALSEPVVIVSLNDDENDCVNEDDSAVVMSGPGIVPIYSPDPAGVSISDADNMTVPIFDPLNTVVNDCENS